MKKYFLLLFFCNQLNAQNLVPNPSFEDTVACPNNGRITNCLSWQNFGNSPDYNHSCSPVGNAFGVPSNTIGFQYSATGNAYCDLWTYAVGGLYREYIGTQLINPLTIGKTYTVSFKCSPGTLNGYSLQSNNLGLKFSTVSFDSLSLPPVNNFAHIYSTNIITDTANWSTIDGDFIADSSYAYLIIGNFFDDQNTDTANYDATSSFFSVYYVDDVVVVEKDPIGVDDPNKSDIKYSIDRDDNLLQINSLFCDLVSIEFFNSNGVIVLHEENKGNCEISFNLNQVNMQSGLYVCRVKSQKTILCFKLIKPIK